MGEVEIVSGPPRFARDDIRGVVAEACRRAGARRALLFGSYARGTADAASDLDLLIVCDTELPFVTQPDPAAEAERWLAQAENALAFTEHGPRLGFFSQACAAGLPGGAVGIRATRPREG